MWMYGRDQQGRDLEFYLSTSDAIKVNQNQEIPIQVSYLDMDPIVGQEIGETTIGTLDLVEECLNHPSPWGNTNPAEGTTGGPKSYPSWRK